MSALDALSKGLYGISAHRELPEGEEFGTSFIVAGETWIVTQHEVDRVKNMPSADEMRRMIAKVTEWMTP